MRGLHELDPTHALIHGARSTLQRLALFFGACSFSTLIAGACVYLPQLPNALRYHGILECIGGVLGAIALSPLGWLVLTLVGLDGVGILMLPVLATALLLILYAERAFWHGVFLILLLQPLHSMSAIEDNEVTLLSWMLLSCYTAGMSLFYVHCIRSNRAALQGV